MMGKIPQVQSQGHENNGLGNPFPEEESGSDQRTYSNPR